MDIPEWEGRKYGRQKVNAAHAYGGPDLVIKTLESNLCIPIHHYIRTNFEGLVGMVDEIGGVELYVEKDMDYDDNWGQLHIHLKQGWQVLDGDKAHQYSRFRHDREGDIGRIRRQQKLVEAIARKVLSTGMILKLPSLMEKAQEYITTDMRRRELMSLAMFLKEVNSDQIAMEMLPVYDDGPDLLPQREEAGELLQTLFGDSFKQDGWNSLAFPRRVREGGTTRPRPARKPPQPSAPASEATETKVGDEEASWPTAEVVEEGEVEQVPSGKSETGQGGEKETVSPGEGTDGTVSPDESVPPQEDSQSEEGTPPPPKVEPSPPDKVEPPPKRQPEIRGGESTEKPGLQKWVCTFA
jgi:LCP family protein required for cell wall assembly